MLCLKNLILSKRDAELYTKNGILGGHPDSNKINGVDFSTGSLGHGFPAAVGLASAFKILKSKYKVYCLIGDGECNEGTIWESALVLTS